MGWRYLFFTLGALTLAIFVIRYFIFPFYESPKFLLAKGKDQAAVDVVRKVAKFNGKVCTLTVESLGTQGNESEAGGQFEKSWRQRLFEELSRLKILFADWRMTRITILVWVTWMFDYWGKNTFYIFTSQRPLIMLIGRIRHRWHLSAHNFAAKKLRDSPKLGANICRLFDRVSPWHPCHRSRDHHGPAACDW